MVAVASGNGYLPCISLTKYFRKGIRNKIPNAPPRNDARKTFAKSTEILGYLACNIYNAGRVKIAPATTFPEHAPMLCIMTFSPNAPLRFAAPDIPTAIMAMGMAASNT